MHHLRSESRANELATPFAALAAFAAELAQHLRDGGAVLRVEVCVDLVEEVEGRGVALLDGEDEGERAQRLLPARELLNALLLVVLGVEGHGDADARVVLDARRLAAVLGRRLVAVGIVVRAARVAVRAALDDEPAGAGGHELDEDFFEEFGDLFEGAGDGFVFALVEHFDELLDVVARFCEVVASRGECFAPLGEVFVLLERFLVDV